MHSMAFPLKHSLANIIVEANIQTLFLADLHLELGFNNKTIFASVRSLLLCYPAVTLEGQRVVGSKADQLFPQRATWPPNIKPASNQLSTCEERLYVVL